MALTLGQLAAAMRITAGEDPEEPIRSIILRLQGVADAYIQLLIPNAPDAIKDEVMVRFASYLYDAPRAGRGDFYGNAWRNSGAGQLASRWQERRAAEAAEIAAGEAAERLNIEDAQAVFDAIEDLLDTWLGENWDTDNVQWRYMGVHDRDDPGVSALRPTENIFWRIDGDGGLDPSRLYQFRAGKDSGRAWISHHTEAVGGGRVLQVNGIAYLAAEVSIPDDPAGNNAYLAIYGEQDDWPHNNALPTFAMTQLYRIKLWRHFLPLRDTWGGEGGSSEDPISLRIYAAVRTNDRNFVAGDYLGTQGATAAGFPNIDLTFPEYTGEAWISFAFPAGHELPLQAQYTGHNLLGQLPQQDGTITIDGATYVRRSSNNQLSNAFSGSSWRVIYNAMNPPAAEGAGLNQEQVQALIDAGNFTTLAAVQALGYQTAAQVQAAIAAAGTGTGLTTMQVQALIDAGGFQTAAQVQALIDAAAPAAARLVPTGGTEGQFVRKGASDPEWADLPDAGGLGLHTIANFAMANNQYKGTGYTVPESARLLWVGFETTDGAIPDTSTAGPFGPIDVYRLRDRAAAAHDGVPANADRYSVSEYGPNAARGFQAGITAAGQLLLAGDSSGITGNQYQVRIYAL